MTERLRRALHLMPRRAAHVFPRRRAPSAPLTAALLLAAGLAALHPALAQRSGAPITVIYPEPRSPERFVPIVVDGVRYVSTNDLARVLGATKFWRPEIKKLSLRIGEHTLRFTVDVPIVIVNEEAKNLVAPALLVKGVVYTPESIVGKLFDWGVATFGTWDETMRTIRFREPLHSIRQAQLWERGPVTEISGTLLKSLPARLIYATPSEIRVLFEGGTLDSARSFQGSLVRDGSIRNVAGGVDVRLVLSDSARGYQVSASANRMKVAVTSDGNMVDAGLFAQLEPIRLGTDGREVRTIVIDPGHGGPDFGAALPGGMAEKDVALEIARSLRSAIQGRLNVRVLLTRESDVALSPTQRAEVANSAAADLFVGVHLEGEGAVKGGGFRIFAQSPLAGNAEAVAPVYLPGNRDGTELRPWRTAQAAVVGSSMAFGQSVADAMSRSFPESPVVFRTGRMSVLEPVLCPGIIIESAPAYRSAPEGARGYTAYEYTQAVARAIEEFVRRSRT